MTKNKSILLLTLALCALAAIVSGAENKPAKGVRKPTNSATPSKPTPPTSAAFPDLAPKKQSLTIPITLAPSRAQSAPSVECVVTCGPAVPITALAFSPDGKTLAVGGYQEVLLWDLVNARFKRVGVKQLSNAVHALAFSKDGKLLAVAEGTPYSSGAVRVFDAETGQLTVSFQEPKDVVYCLAFSPDGKFLAAGGADTFVHVWDMEDKVGNGRRAVPKVAATLKEHSDWVLGVAFSPDGKSLASGSADRFVQIWEVGTWNPVIKLQQADSVHGLAFSPDGDFIAAAVGGPSAKGIRIGRKDDPRQRQQARALDTGAATPLDVLWASQVETPQRNRFQQGGRIIVPCSDKTVKVFNPFGTLLSTLSGHGDWVYTVALSPDGTKLASGSADGTVKLWSAANGSLLATLVQLSPRTDDWLILTAQGYFAASSASAIQWKTTNLTTPPEKLTSTLQSSESVQKVIAGDRVAPPVLP